ncbi:MAG: fimbrillin family protein [Bacteroidales bacterium]|nr:fimbrillin family protein [Bacteroidales bacterium]
MKKLIFVSLLGLIAMASCNKIDDNFPAQVELVPMVFNATTADSDVSQKTSLSGNAVLWQSGDAIGVVSGGALSRLEISGGVGTASASFSGLAGATAPYYAFYPYQEGVTLEDGVLKNINLPRRQIATLGGFDPRCNIMVAASNTTDLTFRQVCSYIKVTTDFPCKHITFKSTYNGVPLVGKCNAGYVASGAFPITPQADTAIVSLVPPSGNSTFAAGTYLIAVLPATLTRGFSIIFTDEDDKVYVRTSNSQVSLSRGDILDLGAFSKMRTPWSLTIDYVQLWAGGPYWATENLGATSAGGFGDYYAWGEIEPYYTEIHNSGGVSVWRNSKGNGYVTGSYPLSNITLWGSSSELLSAYDAASQLYGGLWTLPTASEMAYLVNNCSPQYDSQRRGYIFHSVDLSKSIFLPMAGGFNSRSNSSVGSEGYYWTSSKVSGIYRAEYYKFESDSISINHRSGCQGYSIRPVRRVQ